MTDSQPILREGERLAGRPARAEPGLEELVTGVRAVVAGHADWRRTAHLVAGELRRHLPSPEVLSAEQRIGDPETYRSYVLHAEPDGAFSIVALVWRPGQVTPIHDHVTWCVRSRSISTGRMFPGSAPASGGTTISPCSPPDLP